MTAGNSEIKFTLPLDGEAARIFSADAAAFLTKMLARFSARREQLLAARAQRQAKWDAGELPDFLPETREIREGDWQVSPPPPALQDRRVEITAPADYKKVILALNSPAKVFLADFEDALSPSWQNLVNGQAALRDAANGKCEFFDEEKNKRYELRADFNCAPVARPRGWHLPEKHILFNGQPAAAALVDFAMFVFHSGHALLEKGKGPFLYLPKVEHYTEAALWQDAIKFAEQELKLPAGSIKATLLVETLPAVFQMHEILHALRDNIVGLNCGRWDYIFSYIKTLRHHPGRILPERNAVTMATPFLSAYSRLLVQTCHRRGAHAMGGMSAFIPVRGDAAANDAAYAKVREDKRREAENGHDGTWVAHPDLIPVAQEVFDELMPAASQKDKTPEGDITAADLLAPSEGGITAAGVDNNIHAAVHYIAAWLGGQGAVPIFNMMEDAATAEIARMQLWQWIRHPQARLDDGGEINAALFKQRLEAVLPEVKKGLENSAAAAHADAAAALLQELVLAETPDDFLTLRAYEML